MTHLPPIRPSGLNAMQQHRPHRPSFALRRRASRIRLSHPSHGSLLDFTALDVPSVDDDEEEDDENDLSQRLADDLDCEGILATVLAMLQGTPVRNRHQRRQARSSRINMAVLLLLLFGTIAKRNRSKFHLGHPSTSDAAHPHQQHLGSALLGSVTTVLGPILPFAGGMDLRRGEHWGLDDGLDDIIRNKSSRWSGWWWQRPSSKERSADLASNVDMMVPRGGAHDTPSSPNSSKNSRSRRSIRSLPPIKRESVIAASNPLLPTETIAQLTLGDVALAFRYAIESGAKGFDGDEFRRSVTSDGDGAEGVSDRLNRVLEAMEEVVAESRGEGVREALTEARSSSSEDENENEEEEDDVAASITTGDAFAPLSSRAGYGDVDALKFCAAMRLLAEWRLLRQVPDGYKGYAVGMSLGHKDVVQNLVKIEEAIHNLIALRKLQIEEEELWGERSCRHEEGGNDNDDPTCEAAATNKQEDSTLSSTSSFPSHPRSPTLRELLQYEIDEEIQNVDKLPRLKEKSAGMGMLWVRRQLEYQTEIFGNVLVVPEVYPTATEGIAAAYSAVYDRFHGWAVQKIFNYSFQAAPTPDVIFRNMNPTRLKEVTQAALNGEIEGDEIASDDALFVQDEEEDEEMYTTESLLVFDEELNQTPFYSSAFSNQTDFVEDWAASAAAASVKDESSNPFLRFGIHIVSEWDKFSGNIESEWNKLGGHFESEWNKFGQHIEGEWEKVASNILQLFKSDDDPNNNGRHKSKDQSRTQENIRSLSGDALERYISDKMEEDAKMHIDQYLMVIPDLLEDIAGLFDEFNFDDPTKV